MSLDANGESEPTGRVPANTVATSAVLPQYHHRGSCMSLDANGESVPARSSLVCMSCCPHRQCSVESPRQWCCRHWPTGSRSLNANGESVPFAVRTGLHFMQYNHRGSYLVRGVVSFDRREMLLGTLLSANGTHAQINHFRSRRSS